MDAVALRAILFFYLLISFLLAVFYLRNRQLSFRTYSLWGLFALFFPVLGPFLVILISPGIVPERSQFNEK